MAGFMLMSDKNPPIRPGMSQRLVLCLRRLLLCRFSLSCNCCAIRHVLVRLEEH